MDPSFGGQNAAEAYGYFPRSHFICGERCAARPPPLAAPAAFISARSEAGGGYCSS